MRNCELHNCDDAPERACTTSGARAPETGGMRILRYVLIAVLAVGLLVTSVGWYLSAHPGGEQFESCHWEGSNLVLGYTYGSGDTVSTMVHPDGDHVVAQLRVERAEGATTMQALTGQATYPVSGGPLPVEYPNGAELNCPVH